MYVAKILAAISELLAAPGSLFYTSTLHGITFVKTSEPGVSVGSTEM